jgi:ABC-type Fe3+ transport system permease subunit
MPAFLIHAPQPVEGMVRSQSLSPGRLIFLVALVIMFTLLFVVLYIWMRKPGFGQQEHHQPAASKRAATSDGRPALTMVAVPPPAVAPNTDAEPQTRLLADIAL